jgi:NDP-sugar pyrophosphorylase family protein
MTLQRSEFVLLRYLREEKPHGSAGGLYNFKDLLMEEDPVIHSTLLFL